MTHGVVIGKFYPLHLGHVRLIEFALQQVDHLNIILCSQPEQSPTGNQRQGWLSELFPTAKIHHTPDDLPEAPEPWAHRTLQILSSPPTHVISSESYGEPYAAAMNAKSLLYDLDRQQTPISGTLIRNNPLKFWEYLPAPSREHYAIRIVGIGAESTGKSTLLEQLAHHYRTEFVSEYGREYTDQLYQGTLTQAAVGEGYKWRTSDFLKIAQVQSERENIAARECNGLLFCDTNPWATGLWHERYLGHRNPELDTIGKLWPAHLYLLTAPDLPFIQDGLRDGEEIRGWMHNRFLQELTSNQLPHQIITGIGSTRLKNAIATVEKSLSNY